MGQLRDLHRRAIHAAEEDRIGGFNGASDTGEVVRQRIAAKDVVAHHRRGEFCIERRRSFDLCFTAGALVTMGGVSDPELSDCWACATDGKKLTAAVTSAALVAQAPTLP